jgi:spermidine synthase
MASGKPWPGLVWKDPTGPAPILAADRFRNNRHPILSPLGWVVQARRSLDFIQP